MKKRKWMKFLLVFIIILITGGVMIYYYLSKNLEKLKDEPISIVELEELSDGNYEGEYSVFPVHVKVDVEMINHEIAEITILEHDHGRGAAAEAITSEIIDQQSLAVDAISGATYSSMVIIKAVEDALIN